MASLGIAIPGYQPVPEQGDAPYVETQVIITQAETDSGLEFSFGPGQALVVDVEDLLWAIEGLKLLHKSQEKMLAVP